MRAVAILSALVGFVSLAWAKKPAFEPYDQGSVHLRAPVGWKVNVDEAQGTAVFARDPSRADAPLLILIVRDSGQVKDDELIDEVVRAAGAGFKVVTRGRLSSGGLQLVEEGKHEGVVLRLGAVVLEHGQHILVGLLVGRPNDFADLGGVSLIVDLLSGWLERNAPAKEGAAAPAPKPPAAGLRAADLVGKWSTSTGSVSGTEAGARVSGDGTTFTFTADGKYDASFAGISGGTIWRNRDKGTWAIEGGLLVLKGKERVQRYRFLGAETVGGQQVIRVIDDYFGPDQEVWWTESWAKQP